MHTIAKTTLRGARLAVPGAFFFFIWLVFAASACEPAKLGLPEPGPNAVEVTFSTDPPGATIMVDGTPLGAGPVKAKLNPGLHKMKAMKSGYFTADKQITLSSADKGKSFALTLVASH